MDLLPSLLLHSLSLRSLLGSTMSLRLGLMLPSSFRCSVDRWLIVLRTLVSWCTYWYNMWTSYHHYNWFPLITGAWFFLLNFVTRLCVISNAFIIAITSTFIDREVFRNVYDTNETQTLLCNSGSVRVENCTEDPILGFVAWSTTPFPLTTLLEPLTDVENNTAFPVYRRQRLEDYNGDTSLDVSEVFVDHLQAKWHVHKHNVIMRNCISIPVLHVCHHSTLAMMWCCDTVALYKLVSCCTCNSKVNILTPVTVSLHRHMHTHARTHTRAHTRISLALLPLCKEEGSGNTQMP